MEVYISSLLLFGYIINFNKASRRKFTKQLGSKMVHSYCHSFECNTTYFCVNFYGNSNLFTKLSTIFLVQLLWCF